MKTNTRAGLKVKGTIKAGGIGSTNHNRIGQNISQEYAPGRSFSDSGKIAPSTRIGDRRPGLKVSAGLKAGEILQQNHNPRLRGLRGVLRREVR